MLTKGVDVLIVAPHNGEIAASIVEAAHRQGVPVISYDRLIQQLRRRSLRLAPGRQDRARCRRSTRCDHAPKGNYVLIGGSQTDNNALLLREGQMNILKPAIDRGDIKIVSDQFAREWMAERGAAHHRGCADENQQRHPGHRGFERRHGRRRDLGLAAAAGRQSSGHRTGRQPRRRAAHRRGQADDDDLQTDQAAGLTARSMRRIKLARGEKVDAKDKINNGKIDVPSILQEPIVRRQKQRDADGHQGRLSQAGRRLQERAEGSMAQSQ